MEPAEKNSQTILNEYLRDLSSCSYDSEQLVDKSRILLDIYNGKFRHSYSQILGVIISIKNHEHSGAPNSLSLDFLTENVELFKNIIVNHPDFTSIEPHLSKLYDHTMLEISRINYLGILSGRQLDLETGLKNSAENLRVAKGTLEKAAKETESLKSETITIIGIFSAIMLVFVGGMNFTSATLSSLHQSSIYKIVFMALVCGFIIFNTIFCLMYIISRMTNMNIYSQCKNGDCITGDCTEDCGIKSKMEKRLPYIYWVNILVIIALFLTFVAWFIEIKNIAEWIREGIKNRLK
jgi:hypothetical protein